MDEKQFGAITRAMGREITRRGALARLAGGLAAAAGASRCGWRTANAQEASCTITKPNGSVDIIVPGGPSGDDVQPFVAADDGECIQNPTCADLGYANEFKADPPNSGTYNLPCGGKVTVVSDGVYFDWSSTVVSMDAVIAKGGQPGNVYVYNPESFGDTGLHSPINPNNGEPFGLSHISFCYDDELQVTKTAETTFTRTWNWTIDKTCPADILLSPGQTFNAQYKVDVNATSTDSAWAVSGDISIVNPSCNAATIQSVTDTISGGANAPVDCGVTFPHVLGAGQTLNCTYSAALPDGADRTNTVTVATSGAVGGGSDTADVDFGAPTTETDECVAVTDTLGGNLGTVCEGDADKTFDYSYLVDADNFTCGPNTLSNTATFTTNDTGTTGSDSCNVTVTVACAGGCTLTQGYWKTHSAKGPAPYDDTWAQIGEDTIFFKSGASYYTVLWTPPKGGNAYYILAHQYIAAQLNQLNGASIPAGVKTAFDAATAWLTANDPGKAGAAKKQLTAWAATLAAYNEGATGPGHCSEDQTSVAGFKQEASSSSKDKNKKKKKQKSGKKGKKGGKGKQAGKESKGGKKRGNRHSRN